MQHGDRPTVKYVQVDTNYPVARPRLKNILYFYCVHMDFLGGKSVQYFIYCELFWGVVVSPLVVALVLQSMDNDSQFPNRTACGVKSIPLPGQGEFFDVKNRTNSQR
jgi:hypothetical protein